MALWSKACTVITFNEYWTVQSCWGSGRPSAKRIVFRLCELLNFTVFVSHTEIWVKPDQLGSTVTMKKMLGYTKSACLYPRPGKHLWQGCVEPWNRPLQSRWSHSASCVGTLNLHLLILIIVFFFFWEPATKHSLLAVRKVLPYNHENKWSRRWWCVCVFYGARQASRKSSVPPTGRPSGEIGMRGMTPRAGRSVLQVGRTVQLYVAWRARTHAYACGDVVNQDML